MQCKEAAKRGLSRIWRYDERALEQLTQQCAQNLSGVAMLRLQAG